MLRIAIASLVAALAVAAPAAAQDYPARPVKLVFPLAAGGGGDVFSRALADESAKLWQQPVIVENRPGGGQNIGARACAEAVPDGYTICVMSSEPAVYNEFLYKSIPYNPEKDFTPIANLFFNTLSIVANSDLKVKSLPELVALAKTRPGAELRHVLVPADRVHGAAEEEREHRYREGALPGRRRRGQRGARRLDADRAARALQHGAADPERPHHPARGDLESALAAVPRCADPEGGAGRGISIDLVRPVCAGGRAAADRREDCARCAPDHGRARVPASASISTAPSSPRWSGSTSLRASSPRNASSPSRSSRRAASSRGRVLTAVIPGPRRSAFTRVFDALWRANPESRAEIARLLRLWIPGSPALRRAPE